MTDDANTAAIYRRGFSAGAQAVIEAVGDSISEEQRRVLERWMTGPVEEWRTAANDASPPPLPMIDGA